jgi:hypothetical protein
MRTSNSYDLGHDQFISVVNYIYFIFSRALNCPSLLNDVNHGNNITSVNLY